MKILLLEHPRVIAPERCNDIANTPLSSCLLSGYAGGVLQNEGHEVEIVEGFLDRLSYDQIEAAVAGFKPDILGVHMVYHWQTDLALFGFLEKMKGTGLAPYITAFGFYPTIAFADILQECPAVHSVIVGEPEMTFAELAKAVSGRVGPEGVLELDGGMPGLAVRDSLGGVACKRRELVSDLDSLPFPIRTEALYRLPEVNLQGSRGCYGGCTFCYINPFYGLGSRWRGRSPENIAAEIDGIMSEQGTRYFYFTDPNFFGPGLKGQERARRLAALLKPRNIRFGIEARVNDIHDDTIGALVEAGLRHILIGLESGRDESLKRMNKMTTVAQNERAIGILRKHGIEPNIGFIMFEPDSTLEDVRTNFEFLKRNELLNNLAITANVLYHHQIILKGTRAFQQLQQEGRLVISPSSSYEGMTYFTDREKVGVLAGMMREIANFVFDRMADIWGAKVPEPPNAKEKYASMNRILVESFENMLNALEAGRRFAVDEQQAFVEETKNRMDKLLQG